MRWMISSMFTSNTSAFMRVAHHTNACSAQVCRPRLAAATRSRDQAGVDAARARHFAGESLYGQLGLLETEIVGVHALQRDTPRFDQTDGGFVGAPGHAERAF